MEEKDKIIVKWSQEDVETSNNLLNNNIKMHGPVNVKYWLTISNRTRQLLSLPSQFIIHDHSLIPPYTARDVEKALVHEH
jgi:hypothetical protein